MFQNQHQATHQSQTQVGVNPDDPVSFINLPLELQRKIWKHAAVSRSRVIQLKLCEFVNTYDPRASGMQYQIPYKKYLPEVLLETCSESRDIVKKIYKYTTFLGRPFCYDPDIDVFWVRGIIAFGLAQQLNLGRAEGFAGGLYEQKEQLIIRPYLFRSVALDFAAIKESHKDPITSTGVQDAHYFWPAISYGIPGTKIEKIYIVYSSGDLRDEVDREVEDFIDKLNSLCRPGYMHRWVRMHLEQKNKRETART
ncbi:hypothetical protein EYC80_001396 [Monilinia laxa]|uniref:2EXR domain-containing protein n=1 Tax=Monilinia laxa TaxID=61186 RepID=A0A5N6K9C6_MONLA|nr:hypothetical protein EYC80_001396 [Monilinia laxa]